MTGFFDSIEKIEPGKPWNGRFTGGIDVGEKYELGLGENGKKFREQCLSPAVAVRLKGNYESPPGIGLSNSGQSHLDFGGMVAVVVNDGDALGLALDFEPSLDFAGARQTRFDRGEFKPQGKADGGGGQGIADIVTAGQGDVNRVPVPDHAAPGYRNCPDRQSEYDGPDRRRRHAGHR